MKKSSSFKFATLRVPESDSYKKAKEETPAQIQKKVIAEIDRINKVEWFRPRT